MDLTQVTPDNFETAMVELTEDIKKEFGKATKDVIEKTGIVEDENHFFVRVEFPGFDKESLDIELDGKQLVVKAKFEKERAEDGEYAFESNAKAKSVRIPNNADPDSAIAKFKDGVVIVRFDKRNPKVRSIHPDENLS